MNSIFLRGGPFLEAVFHSTFKLCSSFRTGLFLRGGAHHASGGQRGYRPSGFPVRGASRPPDPGENGDAAVPFLNWGIVNGNAVCDALGEKEDGG